MKNEEKYLTIIAKEEKSIKYEEEKYSASSYQEEKRKQGTGLLAAICRL